MEYLWVCRCRIERRMHKLVINHKVGKYSANWDGTKKNRIEKNGNDFVRWKIRRHRLQSSKSISPQVNWILKWNERAAIENGSRQQQEKQVHFRRLHIFRFFWLRIQRATKPFAFNWIFHALPFTTIIATKWMAKSHRASNAEQTKNMLISYQRMAHENLCRRIYFFSSFCFLFFAHSFGNFLAAARAHVR